MNEVEKDMLRKAREGEGALSNNLFKLRFYGYFDKAKKRGLLYRILSLLVFAIASAITFLVIIAGIVFIMFLLIR